MRRRVYIETSVVSYLASRPSRDLVAAGRQQLTQMWWEMRRPAFDLVISQVVLDEALETLARLSVEWRSLRPCRYWT